MRVLIFFAVTLLASICVADDVMRVSSTYSTGALVHNGDVVGSSGEVSGLLVETEFLGKIWSSSYGVRYLRGSENGSVVAWEASKGWYLFPYGAQNSLEMPFSFRMGLNAGVGEFAMRDVKMNGLRYAELKSGTIAMNARVDVFAKISPRAHAALGAMYESAAGTQSVFWTYTRKSATLSLFYSF
jgi:hypothetical protein